MKTIILEGLPKVGKSTILKRIECMNLRNVSVSEEIVFEKCKSKNSTTFDFMKNDELKLQNYKKNHLVVDRGPISTLSYNQTEKITNLDYDFDLNALNLWFKKFVDFYKSDDVFVLYLKQRQSIYRFRERSKIAPHGTTENQKLMEDITLYNCKKYVKHLLVRRYSYEEIDEVVNEIVDKLMRP